MCALVTSGVAGAVLMKRYPAPFLQRGNMRYCDFHQEMINAFAGCSDCVAATADKGVSDSEPPGIEGRDESRDKASPATADAPPEEVPDNRCRRCVRTLDEAIDNGADGDKVQQANDYLDHGGHFFCCPMYRFPRSSVRENIEAAHTPPPSDAAPVAVRCRRTDVPDKWLYWHPGEPSHLDPRNYTRGRDDFEVQAVYAHPEDAPRDPEKCPSCDLRMVPEYVGTKLRCTACEFLWETV